jgi:hypothetical protein
MKIDPHSLKVSYMMRYLTHKGWKNHEHKNPNIFYLESPIAEDGSYYSVVLPRSRDYSDFSARAFSALEQISLFEKKNIESVYDRMIRWNIDTFKTRIFKRDSGIDSIPLKLASDIVDSLKGLIGASAYSEVEPLKYFSKLGGAAKDFAEHCHFGHTYRGSFGLAIECPIPGIDQLAFDSNLQEKPFERKVLERLALGYSSLESAISSDSADPLLESYERGFNANMLESLVTIYEKLDMLSVDYEFEWTPELAPESGVIERPFRFDGRAHELAKFAANELSRELPCESTTVKSYIVSLKSEMPPTEEIQEKFEHIVTLKWEKERGVFVSVRVPLPPEEYRKACDAHKTGRKIIVVGIPEKQGKFWILTNPSEVTFDV